MKRKRAQECWPSWDGRCEVCGGHVQEDEEVTRDGDFRIAHLSCAVDAQDVDIRSAAATLGRKGGGVKTAAKSAAARENGRKGARPALLWSHEGDWTSAKIFASPRGWRVETQSSIQGEWDGRVVFVPYSGRFPWGLDMEGSWNGSTTNGQALVHFCEQEAGSRVLKAGRGVE